MKWLVGVVSAITMGLVSAAGFAAPNAHADEVA